MAELINMHLAAAGLRADWHGGKLRDVGIDRAAEKRLARWAWEAVQAAEARGADPVAAIKRAAAEKRIGENALAKNLRVYRWNVEIRAGYDPRKTLDSEAKAYRRRREDERRKRKEEREEVRRARWRREGVVPVEKLQAVRKANQNAQFDKLRATQERDQAQAKATELVEVVEGLKVRLKDAETERPATARQVKTLLKMAAERGMQVHPDTPMTIGTVGATVRQLQELPVKQPQESQGEQMPQLPTSDPQKPPKPPSGPESSHRDYPPFAIHPAEHREARYQVARWADAEVIGRLDATRRALAEIGHGKPSSLDAGQNRLALNTGTKALEAEARARGLIGPGASGRGYRVPEL